MEVNSLGQQKPYQWQDEKHYGVDSLRYSLRLRQQKVDTEATKTRKKNEGDDAAMEKKRDFLVLKS